MQAIYEPLYQVLNYVIPEQVSYGKKESLEQIDNYIVYQEISNRGSLYADDRVHMRILTIQINLITKEKNLELEERLEVSLSLANYEFQMLSEYQNEDGSINRVYEIKMEVL
jgi:hypothetical protein